MKAKELKAAKESFDVVNECKEKLLKLCDGKEVSFAIAVFLAAADEFLGTAKEIREQTADRKNVF